MAVGGQEEGLRTGAITTSVSFHTYIGNTLTFGATGCPYIDTFVLREILSMPEHYT